jgi:hypothetical protein
MKDEGNTFTTSQKEVLARFIDQMIDEKRIPKTDRLRAELEEKLSDAVMTEILMNLPDYLLDKINAAYDENRASEELIAEIVREAGIDTTQIARKAMLNFREEFLA